MEGMQLPPVVSSALTIKVGEALSSSRTNVGAHDFLVQVDDGYDVLLARVVRYVAQTAATYKESNIGKRDKPTLETQNIVLYLKPANSTNQSNYLRLDGNSFFENINLAWRNSFTGTGGPANFRLQLFVYCAKKSNSTQTAMRASSARIEEARQAVSIDTLRFIYAV